MSLRLYMDVNVRKEITEGVAARGVDVITAQDDSSRELPDPELLDRAGALGRALFTHDEDFLIEGAARQRTSRAFGGIIYAHPLRITIAQCIDDLELVAKVYDPEEIRGQIARLPLR